ncbi:polyamine ABC transporter substrate-binding protein [Yinghuangia soli]|uniref:Spermidine/putrescine ABC transporter substrate-binding protein n=1 Tax=Yinghuangia soli TaxID=2908204 RepID=A0AA41Q715_9ACTN|nr:spermidine/putrescine ABC transporter substrate-binding protein [Yinghuangia soli]MCF2532780.1 spermidine/putrescine ABC transporter substrate-binding protein [Yinghuangia soli]
MSPAVRAAAIRSMTTGRGAALRNAMSRRSILRGSAMAGLAVAGGSLLAACSDDDDKKDSADDGGSGGAGQVVFSNWPLYIDVAEDDENKHPTLDAFTKETGIKVKYTEDINDNNEFYAKIQPQLASGDDTKRDLIVLTDWMASRLVRLQYVQKMDPANVPNAVKNLDPRFKGNTWDAKREYAYPWTQLSTLIAYNSKATEGYAPESVDDLLTNPKLKGKVALLTEMRDTVGMVLLSMGKKTESFTDDDFNAALAKIQKAVDSKQIRRFTGNDYVQELASGDIAACLAWSGDLIQLQADNPEVQFVIPKHGYATGTDELLIPTKAANKANAEKLIDYYYRPEVAAQLTLSINYVSPVVGVQPELLRMDPAIASNQLVMPSPETAAKANTFRALSEAEETKYEEAFAKVIGV